MANIYILKDELNNIRYVGKTVQKPEQRLNAHMLEAKKSKEHNHRLHWIRSMIAKELKPTVQLIDWEEDYTKAGEWEKYWIKFFKDEGYNLTNNTEGGDGTIGRKCSEKTKLAISRTHTGRKLPPEHIEAIRAAAKRLKGVKKSPEHVQNMRIAQLKYYQEHPEALKKMSERVKGRPAWNKGKTGIYTEETRKIMSEKAKARLKGQAPWNKGKKLSEEQKKNFIGRKPWNKGIAHSEETRRKISEALKGKPVWNKGLKKSLIKD